MTEELVKQRAPEIALLIQRSAQGSPVEADFCQPVEQALAQFAEEAHVPLRTHHEYGLAVGRADTVYNRLVIENKRPGHLSDSLSSRNNQAAIGQLRNYVEDIARQQNIKEARSDGRGDRRPTHDLWSFYVGSMTGGATCPS